MKTKILNEKIKSFGVEKEMPGRGDLSDEEDFQNSIRRIKLESGGKVIDFAKYRKSKDPKVKELDLASMFTPDRTLSSLSDKERDAVNTLLKLTFGKKD